MRVSQEIDLTQVQAQTMSTAPRTIGQANEGALQQGVPQQSGTSGAQGSPLVCEGQVPGQNPQQNPGHQSAAAAVYGLNPGAIARVLQCRTMTPGNPGVQQQQQQNPGFTLADLTRQQEIAQVQLQVLQRLAAANTNPEVGQAMQTMQSTLQTLLQILQRIIDLEPFSEQQRQPHYPELIRLLLHIQNEFQFNLYRQLQDQATVWLQQQNAVNQPPTHHTGRSSDTLSATSTSKRAGRKAPHRETGPYSKRSRSNSTSNQPHSGGGATGASTSGQSPATRAQTRTQSSDYMSVGSPAAMGASVNSNASLANRGLASNEHMHLGSSPRSPASARTNERRLSTSSAASSESSARFLSRGDTSIDQSDGGTSGGAGTYSSVRKHQIQSGLI